MFRDITSTLCSSAKGQSDKSELVDLVSESEDECLVECESLWSTLWVAEEFNQRVCQLVP